MIKYFYVDVFGHSLLLTRFHLRNERHEVILFSFQDNVER